MTENVVRHTAERGAAHAKDAYRRTQEAAEETTKVMEQTYSAASKGLAAASKGLADFNLHLLRAGSGRCSGTCSLPSVTIPIPMCAKAR